MPVSDEIQYGGSYTLFLPSLGETASNQNFRGYNGDFLGSTRAPRVVVRALADNIRGGEFR
jgi:hypothetical protein